MRLSSWPWQSGFTTVSHLAIQHHRPSTVLFVSSSSAVIVHRPNLRPTQEFQRNATVVKTWQNDVLSTPEEEEKCFFFPSSTLCFLKKKKKTNVRHYLKEKQCAQTHSRSYTFLQGIKQPELNSFNECIDFISPKWIGTLWWYMGTVVCGDGNYEQCWGRRGFVWGGWGFERFAESPETKFVICRHDITLTQWDWMASWHKRETLCVKHVCILLLLFLQSASKPVQFAGGLFPQRSPCSSSHKSHFKTGLQQLSTVSVTHFGPGSGPQPPHNNIHYFLTLKNEHPFWCILDLVGGAGVKYLV